MADSNNNVVSVELTFKNIVKNDDEPKKCENISLTWGSSPTSGTIIRKVTYCKRTGSTSSWSGSCSATSLSFGITLNQIRFQKQMYSPNLIEVDLMIVPAVIKEEDVIYDVKAFIPNDTIYSTFSKKLVSLKCDGTSTCEDYYIHEIVPRKAGDVMYVHMKIYSLDKLMTLTETCKAYVSKKLGEDILGKSNEDGKTLLSAYATDKATLAVRYSNMKHLIKEETEEITKNGKTESVTVQREHIFPYLVQYNESFYDFLARTTNRWGEFLFYEGDSLNIGYKSLKSDEKAKPIDSYSQLTYHDLSTTNTAHSHDSKYLSEATYDDNVLNSKVKKDTYDVVKGTMINIGNNDRDGDVYLMKKAATFLSNNKSLKNFLFDSAVDDLIEIAQAETRVARKNKKIKDEYFENADRSAGSGLSHYNKDKDAYNEFSEIAPIVDETLYKTIRENEIISAQNAVEIEFDTTFPNVSLGEIIDVDGFSYIVTEIKGYQPEVLILNSKNYYEKGFAANTVNYRITALAVSSDKNYYPSLIPAGHVRKSGSQLAVVVDDFDPNNNNRVRVKFDWQLSKKAELIDADDAGSEDKSDASPWLNFTSPAGTDKAGIHGRHYLGEKVLVDFANGNIERPYIVGAFGNSIPPGLKTGSTVISAPNGEMIRVHEGTGQGAGAFLAGLNPGVKFINSFVPMKIPGEKSARFEGGIDLCDKYGIWSIKGSTDGRNVSISSAWGDVKINAFTGITIAAPNGDVKIQGKNVTIAAGNNLSLISGQNIKNKFISTYGDSNKFSLNSIGFNALSFGQDVAAMALKKVAAKAMDLIDLSILRSIVEIFWRPLEGTLSVKSNRYLKLEAGGATAGFPDALYKNVKKDNKESKLNTTLKMLPGMLDIINSAGCLADKLYKQKKSLYIDSKKKKKLFEDAIAELKKYSNKSNEAVCTDFAGLQEKLWNKNTKEITKEDLAFTDNVKVAFDVIDDNLRARVNNELSSLAPSKGKKFLFFTKKKNDELKQFIQDKRKELRNNVVESANNLLKAIQAFSNCNLDNERIKMALLIRVPVGRHIPDTYIKDIQTALAQKEVGEFFVSNDVKSFTSDNPCQFTMENDKKCFRRYLWSSLMDSWGFEQKDIPGGAEGGGNAKPKKPKEINDYLDDPTWASYVDSLTLSKILNDNSGFFSDLGSSLLNDLLDKNRACFWKPVKEYYSWGNARDGKILFGSGSTYQLNSDGNIGLIDAVGASRKIDVSELDSKQAANLKALEDAIHDALKENAIQNQGQIDLQNGNDEDILDFR